MQDICAPPVQISNLSEVLDRLNRAGTTVLSLRDWTSVPSAFADVWLPIVASTIELGELWTARMLWPEPPPDVVEQMTETLGWLSCLCETDYRIVVSRILQTPGGTKPIIGLTTLAVGMRMSAGEVLRRFDRAVTQIAAQVGVKAESKTTSS